MESGDSRDIVISLLSLFFLLFLIENRNAMCLFIFSMACPRFFVFIFFFPENDSFQLSLIFLLCLIPGSSDLDFYSRSQKDDKVKAVELKSQWSKMLCGVVLVYWLTPF